LQGRSFRVSHCFLLNQFAFHLTELRRGKSVKQALIVSLRQHLEFGLPNDQTVGADILERPKLI
jgi:hypothetical protein